MTAAEISALLEADMAAAVLAGEGPTATNGDAIRVRILDAYADSLTALFTPWLSENSAVGPGEISFTKSPQHASATNYQARLRAEGSDTVIGTQDLGVPTPDVYGVIVADLTTLFSGRAAGTYTVSVAVVTSTGTTDSNPSNAFSLPLA